MGKIKLALVMGIAGLGGLAFAVASHAQSPSVVENHDLFLQARTDERTFSWLIDKTRIILANAEINDRFSGEATIDQMPAFSIDDLMKENDADFARFRDMISNAFKVDFKSAVIRLRFPKLKYSVQNLRARLLNLKANDPALDLQAEIQLNGIDIQLTEGMYLDFMIPNPKTKVLESYLSAHIAPVSLQLTPDMPPLMFEIQLQAIRDQKFHFDLKGANLDAIPAYVQANQSHMPIISVQRNAPFGAEDIQVNPVIVRLNQMTRSLELKPFKPIIQRRIPQITTMVFTQLGQALKKSIGPILLKNIFASTIRSDLIVNNEGLYSRYQTSRFSQPDNNQLILGVSGDLCTAKTYSQYHEQCSQYEPKMDPVRLISEETRLAAFAEVKENIAHGNADVALSISEEYLNRLLKTTIDAKLWDEMLSQEHLAIGPKGAFVVLNQRTRNPELFMDLLYKGEAGLQRLIVNEKHPLRFPLRIGTSLQFTENGGAPHMIIKIEKIISDMNEIINGIPEYEMPSRLVPLLRRRIARMILNMSEEIEGKTAIDMEIAVFKKIGLDHTFHEASPHGRLNLYFKL